MFINETTPRADLLTAIYGDWSLLDRFLTTDRDPENMTDEDLRAEITAWVAEGDECAAA